DQAPRVSELEGRVAAITGQSRDGDQGGYGQQSGDVEWQAMAQDGRPMDPAKQQMATGTAPTGQGGMRTHMVMSPQHGVAIAQVDLPAHWNVQGMQSGNWSLARPGLSVKSTKPVEYQCSC